MLINVLTLLLGKMHAARVAHGGDGLSKAAAEYNLCIPLETQAAAYTACTTSRTRVPRTCSLLLAR